jgi:hypothetical protein
LVPGVLSTGAAAHTSRRLGLPILDPVRAYVDESVRVAPPGLYLMAAVVVPPAAASNVRETLREGLPRRMTRYHWRDESTASRAAMAARVGALGLASVVTYVTTVDPQCQERARRRCLLRLLWELDRRGVTDVVIESRQHRDKYDRDSIAHAGRAGWATRPIRFEFGTPREECLLWLPDIVAGAAGRALADDDPRFLAALGPSVAVVAVP